MGVWHEPPVNWWFLSNNDFMVFLVDWVKRRPDFFMRKPFLGFLLSFFINYVAMSAFYLRNK